MSSLENRSASALFKRSEQLKRWQESDTNKEPVEPKRKSRKIRFPDSCVFLSACAATDKHEVQQMLEKGADIDTANVDGLTALHQACIDDKYDMVEFLVTNGADVNRGDNEGWTPLHATASCGFLSIAEYLLDHGANVAAVNNDGELPIDIAESDDMEELLKKEIESRGIDCEAARRSEEQKMLDDANRWLNVKIYDDKPHDKTGARDLHVAASKGYIKVMMLLFQAGADVNCQDYDGWTPMHAAAHWGQREAMELLCEHDCDLEIKNYVGQTAFDIADPDVKPLMEELRRKQATLQKDRAAQASDIRQIIHRPPMVPTITGTGKRSSLLRPTSNLNSQNNNYINLNLIRNPVRTSDNRRYGLQPTERSSITRLSLDDKALRTKEVSSQERDLLIHKALVPETIPEKKDCVTTFTVTAAPEDKNREEIGKRDDAGIRAPGYSPPIFEDKKSNIENENQEVHPWRRPASLRVRPTTTLDPTPSQTLTNRLSPNNSEDDVTLRRVHSFESDEKFYVKLQELRNRIRATSSPMVDDAASQDDTKSSHTNNNQPTWRKAGKKDEDTSSSEQPKPASQVRRSFVPPVRDEESETQRKAHAKRVRETRRSTQGVTLEDLKSAEQLVKRKQQQENQQRTSELQQLVASQQDSTTTTATSTTAHSSMSSPSVSTSNSNVHSFSQSSAFVNTPPSPTPGVSIIVTSSPSLSSTSNSSHGGSNNSVNEPEGRHERRPSWRMRADTAEKNKFRLEDERLKSTGETTAPTPVARSRTHTQNTLSASLEKDGSPQQIVSRRKKPKRRSTGVVQLEMEDVDQDDDLIEEEEDTANVDPEVADRTEKTTERIHNGEVDYKKLWEEIQLENLKLRDDLNKFKDELKGAKKKLEANNGVPHSSGLSDAEKKEKLALEKKLSEMEEELKQLEHLKNDNQRLRDENGALIRVISKLSK